MFLVSFAELKKLSCLSITFKSFKKKLFFRSFVSKNHKKQQQTKYWEKFLSNRRFAQENFALKRKIPSNENLNQQRRMMTSQFRHRSRHRTSSLPQGAFWRGFSFCRRTILRAILFWRQTFCQVGSIEITCSDWLTDLEWKLPGFA